MQLAVVKSGPALEFYRDAQPAGTATAAYVVNDYGAEVLALGVDYSRLVEPGSNATGIDPAALSGPVGGWGLAGSAWVRPRGQGPTDALCGATPAALYCDEVLWLRRCACTSHPPASCALPRPCCSWAG